MRARNAVLSVMALICSATPHGQQQPGGGTPVTQLRLVCEVTPRVTALAAAAPPPRTVSNPAVTRNATLDETTSRSGRDVTDYAAIVREYRSTPNTATERILAMPQADVASAVAEAVRDSRFTASDYAAALVMHTDIALYLVQQHDGRAGSALELAEDLALATAREHAATWFVHRWYTAVTAALGNDARVTGLRERWKRQEWYRFTSALDHAIEFERLGTRNGQGITAFAGRRPGVDMEVYDTPSFQSAIPLLRQALDGGVNAAAVHLGRIQMLRGYDPEARRLFTIASSDGYSRINRYLGNLFLGAMDERDGKLEVPESRYRAAYATLPGAQSGRLALAALLARYGHAADAARIISADDNRPVRSDPWWSFLAVGGRDAELILAELHAEVLD
jgi:hypothetical protein